MLTSCDDHDDALSPATTGTTAYVKLELQLQRPSSLPHNSCVFVERRAVPLDNFRGKIGIMKKLILSSHVKQTVQWRPSWSWCKWRCRQLSRLLDLGSVSTAHGARMDASCMVKLMILTDCLKPGVYILIEFFYFVKLGLALTNL